jgi:hypothetical protein
MAEGSGGVQVFFYFSGHGATVGHDTAMYSNDGKRVSFYDFFHAHVTTQAAAVIAVLDCCRVTQNQAAEGSGGPDNVCFPATMLSSFLVSQRHPKCMR